MTVAVTHTGGYCCSPHTPTHHYVHDDDRAATTATTTTGLVRFVADTLKTKLTRCDGWNHHSDDRGGVDAAKGRPIIIIRSGALGTEIHSSTRPSLSVAPSSPWSPAAAPLLNTNHPLTTTNPCTIYIEHGIPHYSTPFSMKPVCFLLPHHRVNVGLFNLCVSCCHIRRRQRRPGVGWPHAIATVPISVTDVLGDDRLELAVWLLHGVLRHTHQHTPRPMRRRCSIY